MNKFEEINEWIRGTETSIVNVVSAIAPWLAPISPAYMTYQHAVGTLHFPMWVAVPVAVVVEILGFSAVSTFMTFWFFNRRNKSNGKKAPVSFVVFAFFFYLALIVTSNVLLDTFPGANWAIIVTRALFALQTVPAALIVISRAGHKSLIAEIEKEVSDRKTAGQMTGQMSEKIGQMTGQIGQIADRTGQIEIVSDWRKARKQLPGQQIATIAKMSTTEITAVYGIEDRTARRWRKSAQDETTPPFP